MPKQKSQPGRQGPKSIASPSAPRKKTALAFSPENEPPGKIREFMVSPFWPKLLDTIRLGASPQTAEARCRLKSGQLRSWMQARGPIGDLFRKGIGEALADSVTLAEHSIRERNPEKWLQKIGSTVSTIWSDSPPVEDSPVLTSHTPSQLSLAEALLELQKAGVITFTQPVPNNTVEALKVEGP